MDRASPVIVREDLTVYADSAHPDYPRIRSRLSRYAEPVKSPDGGLHVYRITPVTLWQARAAGLTGDMIAEELDRLDARGLTDAMRAHLVRTADRYGRLVLEEDGDRLRLSAADPETLRAIRALPAAAFCSEWTDAGAAVKREQHGILKRELAKAGWPVIDRTRRRGGAFLPLELAEDRVALRDYQREAAEAFCRDGGEAGGVIVLPCGAGKTLTGIGVMARLRCETLILTGSVTSVRQWKRELLGNTNAREEWIGEYAGRSRQVRPVTIATYHMMASRAPSGAKRHLDLLRRRDWGLVIYDEVHLLPAPAFRLAADVQDIRRLGLTATLVREDGLEHDVFSLIGPKRYDLSWRALESAGYLAEVRCVEVAVPFSAGDRRRYLSAGRREKLRIAGENPLKDEVAARLVKRHAGRKILVIGQYIGQLERLASRIGAPMISGRTPQGRRDELFAAFRGGGLDVLVVSKVANFAVDLPDASVAIQVSGGFGSRQEEAQRVGRILRPKRDGREAWFYTLVTEDSCEREFARRRRRFLAGQGYSYREERAEALLEPDAVPHAAEDCGSENVIGNG
jgi:DNA excision repair protein ERCC-3